MGVGREHFNIDLIAHTLASECLSETQSPTQQKHSSLDHIWPYKRYLFTKQKGVAERHASPTREGFTASLGIHTSGKRRVKTRQKGKKKQSPTKIPPGKSAPAAVVLYSSPVKDRAYSTDKKLCFPKSCIMHLPDALQAGSSHQGVYSRTRAEAEPFQPRTSPLRSAGSSSRVPPKLSRLCIERNTPSIPFQGTLKINGINCNSHSVKACHQCPPARSNMWPIKSNNLMDFKW